MRNPRMALRKKKNKTKQANKQTLDSLFIVEASSSSELMTMVPMSLSTSVASSLLIIIVSWLCTLEAVFINMVLSSPTFTIVPESTASSPSSSSSSSWIQKKQRELTGENGQIQVHLLDLICCDSLRFAVSSISKSTVLD